MILLSISVVCLSIAVTIVNHNLAGLEHKLNLLKDRITRVEEDIDIIATYQEGRIKKLEDKVFPIKDKNGFPITG